MARQPEAKIQGCGATRVASKHVRRPSVPAHCAIGVAERGRIQGGPPPWSHTDQEIGGEREAGSEANVGRGKRGAGSPSKETAFLALLSLTAEEPCPLGLRTRFSTTRFSPPTIIKGKRAGSHSFRHRAEMRGPQRTCSLLPSPWSISARLAEARGLPWDASWTGVIP